MLRRYDLCERAARLMWIELLKINRAGTLRGLAKKILAAHPNMVQDIVEEKLRLIRIARD